MKILFFGTPRFAEIVLEKLVASKHKVVGVVCQTDKPAGRGNKMQTPHIVCVAKEKGIDVFQFDKLSAHIDELKNIDCDVAVTASYGKFLSAKVLELFPVVNVHPSLLPKYRGGTPIQSALLAGDVETGVTIMKTDVGMDDGDIYAQQKVPILPEDDYVSLHDKLAEVGGELLLSTLEQIENGTAVLRKQNDSEATFVKLIEKEDALLDFSQGAYALVNKVRAFCESPVAFFCVDGQRIKVFKARVAEMTSSAAAGEIVCAKKRFLIQTSNGVFEILRCQGEGGKAMDAASFLNGHHFQTMRANG